MNNYNMNAYPTIIDVPREETASLLAKVLAITSLGFLITALGVATAPAWGTPPRPHHRLRPHLRHQLRAQAQRQPRPRPLPRPQLLHGLADRSSHPGTISATSAPASSSTPPHHPEPEWPSWAA